MKPIDKRTVEIINILNKTYPRSRTSLHYKTPLQLLIATILAAQCTDERVNKITSSLFAKYKSNQDFARAMQTILEEEIRSAGLYKNKAKNIIAACQKMVEEFKGNVPDTMEALTSLPGVARKTANIVLASAFRKAEGIAVDTHVKRLSVRMGLTREKNPDKIEQDLMKAVPKKYWLIFNHLLVNHGRKICIARKPLCPECVIKLLCPSSSIFYPKGIN